MAWQEMHHVAQQYCNRGKKPVPGNWQWKGTQIGHANNTHHADRIAHADMLNMLTMLLHILSMFQTLTY